MEGELTATCQGWGRWPLIPGLTLLLSLSWLPPLIVGNPPPPIVASAAQEIATACHLEAEGLLYVPGLKFGVEEANPSLMTLSDHTQSATKPLQKILFITQTDNLRGRKRGSGPLELELQEVLNPSTWC